MKKILQINVCVNQGSTGKIVESIGKKVVEQGWESYVAGTDVVFPSQSKVLKVGNRLARYWHRGMARFLDKQGLGSILSTKAFIRQIQSTQPDLIHLHNLHCAYINYPLLFSFLKAYKRPVVWTFHDCWPMTGHCTHFDSIGCDKWKKACDDCPLIPQLSLDQSRQNYLRKKSYFTSLDSLTIVPVSQWLGELVKQSYFSQCNVVTIKNGIDLSVFQPLDQSSARAKWNLAPRRFTLMGASTSWSDSKGLQEFIKLAENYDYQIIMVGVDAKTKSLLPEQIITFPMIREQRELASLYAAADLFVNPTYNDSFPTVNMEALACGTPVAAYNTGGVPEMVDAETGIVVPRGDKAALFSAIQTMKDGQTREMSEACRKRALAHFDKERNFNQYIELYRSLC